MRNEAVVKLYELSMNSTEKDVRAFVLAHWTEFPTEIQDALAVALMTDAAGPEIAKISQPSDASL